MAAPTGSDDPIQCDVAIIGGGIAGLTVALNLPAQMRVVLITKAALGESNTRYAQGGLAAAVGPDDDPELHLRDTLVAGAGLVDEAATSVLVREAREAVAWLIAAGAHFDERSEDAAGAPDDLAHRYDLAREAAHSRRRVLHARDATGAEIERALVAAYRARPGALLFEETRRSTSFCAIARAWAWMSSAMAPCAGCWRGVVQFWRTAARVSSGCARRIQRERRRMGWRWRGAWARC